MKINSLLAGLLFICVTGFSQLTAFYVKPSATDIQYDSSQDKHYVALNRSAVTNNKLLVFLPGTGADTKNYTEFPRLAANLGYYCVSIAYPNDFPSVTEACTASIDKDCFKDYRQEICYGTPVSNKVTVDTLNSIYTRLVKLLKYLNKTYPGDGWGIFLKQGKPAWNKIAVSGHSQGSGHAFYFGKTQPCYKVIMFSGANDYSDLYKKPANWVSDPGLTPTSSIFSFLHLKDDVVNYSKQYKIVQAIGMTANGDDSTIVDKVSPPYNNSHCLYTKAQPQFSFIYSSWHDGPVVDFYTPKDNKGNYLYIPVWNYMLTSPTNITADKKPFVNRYRELTSEYTRSPRFKDCVKTFVDSGLELEDKILLSVLLDDAGSLEHHLTNNPEAVSKKYILRCAYTPLHEVTLMHICAEFNHLSCAGVLVKHGADINAAAGIDENGFGGQTPIFHTVNQNTNQSADMLNYLLSQSPDLKITVPGFIWGKGYDWETLIPSVNPISYAMMGLLPQMHRSERTISKVVTTLLKQAYEIDYRPNNIPCKYLNS